MIEQLNGTADVAGNDYSQWRTTDATVNNSIRFTPEEKEAGRLTINYNAVNVANANAADRVKMVRFKVVNGVASLTGASILYTNNDTGMNTVDIIVTVSGGEIILTLTGAAGATVIHTVHMIKLSSLIKQ